MSVPVKPSPSLLTSPSTPSPLLYGVRAWDRFWFSATDPATICFIRVCAAALAFYITLSYSWGLLSYIGPHGWVDAQLASEVIVYPAAAPDGNWGETYKLLGDRQSFWSIYYDVTDPRWLIAIHVFFLVNMLLFTLGLWCRYTGMLTWLGVMSYVQRCWLTIFGLDTMMVVLLAYLLIAPTGAVFSLDRWLAVRRARRLGLPDPEVESSVSANFAVRLIQVHLCLIYFAGGTAKLLGPSWWNGTAVSQVLLNPVYAPMESPAYFYTLRFLSQHRWLWELVMSLSTLFTLAFELSFLFLVWNQRWRWLLVFAAVMMHTGIGLLMGLTTFSIAMMVMVSSFFSPATVRSLLAQVGEALSQVLRRSTAAPQPAQTPVLTR